MNRNYSIEEVKNIIINASKNEDITLNEISIDSLIAKADSQRNIKKVEVVENNDYIISHEMFNEFKMTDKDIFKVFDVTTLQSLSNNIIKYSKKYWFEIEEAIDSNYTKEKMLGDLFEIFAEVFFKITSPDNRVGISDYTVINGSEDYGIDGIGIKNNKKCSVQVKFRSKPKDILTIKDLKNFQGLSYSEEYDISNQGKNLIIFTNSIGIHWNTETNVLRTTTITYGNYGNSVDYSLSALIDGNLSFWKQLNRMIDNNLKK